MDLSLNHVKEYNFKVIVIGDAGVGKSSLIARITNGDPNTASFNQRRLKSSMTVSLGKRLVKLHIHDTAGMTIMID
jgi:GTPase SAR1 family protein